MLGGLLLSVAGARHRLSAPTANDITISVDPGGSVVIPFSGSDPDGDLFGFFPTSAPSPASGGTFISVCFCRGFFPNVICACSSSFTASPTFSGTVTFTYRAVDTTGLQSADATATIIVGTGMRTFGQIMDEMRHLIERGLIGGLIRPNFANSLLAKLREAERLESEGKFKAARSLLDAFAVEVAAQSGKGLDPLLAQDLQDEDEVADKKSVEDAIDNRKAEWDTFLKNFYGAGNVPPERSQCLEDSLAAWKSVLGNERVFSGNKIAVFDAADEEFSTCAHGSHPDLTGDAGHIVLNIVGTGALGGREINDVIYDHWAVKDVEFDTANDPGTTLDLRARENGQNWWSFHIAPSGKLALDTSTPQSKPRVAERTLFKIQATVVNPNGVVTTKIRLVHMAPKP